MLKRELEDFYSFTNGTVLKSENISKARKHDAVSVTGFLSALNRALIPTHGRLALQTVSWCALCTLHTSLSETDTGGDSLCRNLSVSYQPGFGSFTSAS